MTIELLDTETEESEDNGSNGGNDKESKESLHDSSPQPQAASNIAPAVGQLDNWTEYISQFVNDANEDVSDGYISPLTIFLIGLFVFSAF